MRRREKPVVPRALLPLTVIEAPLAALAGAVLGFMAAGPIGIVVGLILGTVVGVLVAIALNRQTRIDGERDRLSDEAIGVYYGSLGAPNLEHPPARIGAFSAGSMGRSSWNPEEPENAEGPMPVGDA
jgi:hypothetical protein